MASKGKKKPTARQVNPNGSEAKDQSDNSVAVGLELEADQNQDSNQEREEVDFEHERMSNSINLLFTSPIAQDIPKFSATSTDDVKGWLSRINQLKVAFAASDQDAVRFAAIKANCQQSTKFVAQWIETCEEEEAFDWKEFRRAFLTEFEATDDEGLIEQELLNMRRTKHQTLKDYAKLFENAAAKSPSITDDRKCRLFLNTLPDTVKAAGFIIYNTSKISKSPLTVKMLSAVLASQPEVLVDYQVESSIQPQGSPSNYRPRRETYEQQPRSTYSTQDQRDRNESSHHVKAASVTCFHCGKSGHFARNCRQSRQHRSSPESNHTGASVNSITAESEVFNAEVVINNRARATALVDTGSPINVIRAAFIDLMWPRPNIRPTTHQSVFVGQNQTETFGEVSLSIRVDSVDIPRPISFVIVESCPADMMLGKSFVQTHRDYIRVANETNSRRPESVRPVSSIRFEKSVSNLQIVKSDQVKSWNQQRSEEWKRRVQPVFMNAKPAAIKLVPSFVHAKPPDEIQEQEPVIASQSISSVTIKKEDFTHVFTAGVSPSSQLSEVSSNIESSIELNETITPSSPDVPSVVTAETAEQSASEQVTESNADSQKTEDKDISDSRLLIVAISDTIELPSTATPIISDPTLQSVPLYGSSTKDAFLESLLIIAFILCYMNNSYNLEVVSTTVLFLLELFKCPSPFARFVHSFSLGWSSTTDRRETSLLYDEDRASNILPS